MEQRVRRAGDISFQVNLNNGPMCYSTTDCSGRSDCLYISGCEYYYNPALRKKKEEEKKQIATNLGADVSSSDFTEFIKLLKMSGVLDGEGESLLKSSLGRPAGPLRQSRPKRPKKMGKRPRPGRRPRPRARPVYDYYDYDYNYQDQSFLDEASSRPAVSSRNHNAELPARVSPDC